MTARFAALLAVATACSSASPPREQPDAGPAGTDANSTTQPDAAEQTARYLCRQSPPAGAPTPEAPPLPAAGCPPLVPGLNTITTSGQTRQFLLVTPTTATLPDETFPVLFMWHWLGGSASSFLTKGEVQAAVDQQHFIAVVPVAKGATIIGTSFNTKWPFDISQSSGRMTEEFAFFDDMLACVEQQYAVNVHCVSSVGVSAGALFNAQLAQARSHTLSSFVSLSGGVGATWIKPWHGAARQLPGVVLWGGDGAPGMDGNKDILGCAGIGMDFSVASTSLEDALIDDGHFFVECKHNCGHVEPPLVPPPGESKYAGMWEFALDHPFWLPAGQSPYLTKGLPASLPSWCGIGAGGATPRTGGGCPEAENPCPQ